MPPNILASSRFGNCLTYVRVNVVSIAPTNILKTRIEHATEYALKAALFIMSGTEPDPLRSNIRRSVSERRLSSHHTPALVEWWS